MTRTKSFCKPNGHAGPPGRPNGHAPASSERSGVSHQPGLAVSDDASGLPVANASAHTAAAGTAREAYADLATLPPHGVAPQAAPPSSVRPSRNASARPKSDQDKAEAYLPPGEDPLPDDVAEFVEEVHRKVDLTEVWHSLLRSEDEKIRQRAAERLTALRYKGVAALDDEPQRIVCDIDTAVGRRAAAAAALEGASE